MSSLTNNLSLMKYDADDKITPIGYNKNFDKIDDEITELKTDYVVAQGTKDGWSYRRWAGGMAECWATIEIYNANGYAAGGGFNIPVPLVSADIVIATVNNGNFSNSYTSLGINVKAWWESSNRITVWANSEQTAFNTYNPVPISILIRGRWK